MSQLDAKKRAKLPNSAFAYVDSQGRRRLPINDESHVRNALTRFTQAALQRYQTMRLERTSKMQIGSRSNTFGRTGGDVDIEWVFGYNACAAVGARCGGRCSANAG